jgi:hypothetical protein
VRRQQSNKFDSISMISSEWQCFQAIAFTGREKNWESPVQKNFRENFRGGGNSLEEE